VTSDHFAGTAQKSSPDEFFALFTLTTDDDKLYDYE
jgi:hypothetical protein